MIATPDGNLSIWILTISPGLNDLLREDSNMLYRLLRPDECCGDGLRAKNPNSTTSIQTFLENIFEKFNNWNESEKQKIML
jgi:hypothetical protein